MRQQTIIWSNIDLSFKTPYIVSQGLNELKVSYGRSTLSVLIYSGLMTPYGDMELGQRWLR